jgi:hypothetical protein
MVYSFVYPPPARKPTVYGLLRSLHARGIDAVAEHMPIHEVESKVLKVYLRGGRMALQSLVDCLGDGDVGEEHQLPDGAVVRRSAEAQPRPYVSIFGALDIEQYVYAEREGQAIRFAAIEARLALPVSKFSYLLQDWDQNLAMEQPFGTVNKACNSCPTPRMFSPQTLDRR